MPRRTPAYRPIQHYGIIGNEASVALVRIDGSIDWCCLPFLDSPSIFAALLDARRGGHFLVRPVAGSPLEQRYVPDTNVLVTSFDADGGSLEVIDFMPVGHGLLGVTDRPGEPEIRRHVRCTGGHVEVEVTWAPRLDYARGSTEVEAASGGAFRAQLDGTQVGLAGLPEGRRAEVEDGPAIVGRFTLETGEERVLVTRWDDGAPAINPSGAEKELQRVIRAWREWVHRPNRPSREWTGRWTEQVIRSELFLKLMTQPGSGALAAAATTSLPETLGGVRNWDYRYAWIRDAAQIAQAFFAVGHPEHVDAFVAWAEEVAAAAESLHPGALVPIMHPLRTEVGMEEETLDHLNGYRGSAPVRIGNAAVDQLQLDVYGELLNLVFEQTRLSGRFSHEQRVPFLRHLADASCRKWRVPDFGIWEVRNGPFHHVHSKMMVWVALHRALWLAERGHLDGDVAGWERSKAQIRDEILRFGYDDDLGSFVQRYGEKHLDAANLLLPMMEFLPAEDPRVQGTIDRTLERLTVDDLVYRYREPDGLPGEEGAFVLCTFWMVDALALSGRVEEAERIFESVMGRANHLGLLSEQIDPYSGEFLGNFPQAYSHLGVINSTLYLAEREGREIPIGPLLGGIRS